MLQIKFDLPFTLAPGVKTGCQPPWKMIDCVTPETRSVKQTCMIRFEPLGQKHQMVDKNV